jgi:hypothetical protein
MMYSVSINNAIPLLCEGETAAEALLDFQKSWTFMDELNAMCEHDGIVTITINECKQPLENLR